MDGLGTIGPVQAIVIALLLIIWMIVLVWLGDRLLGYVARRTGWRMRDWRNWAIAVVVLVALVHIANWVIDIAESLIRGDAVDLTPGWPGAFLIGSIAIAVPIAALRRRK